MAYKKLFFPIGGGNELEERIYGAFLIAKYFDTRLDVLKCGLKSNTSIYKPYALPEEIMGEIEKIVDNKYEEEIYEFETMFNRIKEESGIPRYNAGGCKINLKIREGIRSIITERESKFCDLVIAAAPPSGVATATFETAVLKSGKPVLMFPRVMKEFSLNSVIIGWNGSPEASRAITSSLEILKEAQRVHIISSVEYTEDNDSLENLIEYLNLHDIDATYKIVKTTRIPGEALLTGALDGGFDLIVAGAYGHKGLKELMFGGATKYLLEHCSIPVFMSH